MSITYIPNLPLANSSSTPDSWTIGNIPHDNFVVSRDKNREILSIYKDKSWDRTPYSANNKKSWLHFPYWNLEKLSPLQEILHNEAKWIVFVLMWCKDGMPFSHTFLERYTMLLKVMAKYCESEHITIKQALTDSKILNIFIVTEQSQSYISALSALLSNLRKFDFNVLGYEVVSKKKIPLLVSKIESYKDNVQQTAPIPTNIYSEIIARLSKEIELSEPIVNDLSDVLNTCLKKKGNFSNIISAKPALKDYFLLNSIPLNILGISSCIAHLQLIAKLQIHAFSGMRDSEVNNLPFCCLENSISSNTNHYLIRGFTSKFNNGINKEVRWVTSRDGVKAIELAQKISKIIYQYLDKNPIIKSDNFYPLFISTSYLPITANKHKTSNESLTSYDFRLSQHKNLLDKICPEITENDILELEHIDIHRAWRSEEKYQIGKKWPLITHQLRRSLALYAQRTGLVSLPSLRRQLKHITEEMSTYYARGSSYAQNLINKDKTHFASKWQETQPISAALSYINNVLLSEVQLIGGHGNWIEHRLKNNKNTVIIETREETIKRFKNGEMNYKETLLGGCTKVGSCDQPALNWLNTDCLKTGCKNMVCNVSKLEKVIVAQEKLVNNLDKNSLEYRTEKADLEILISVKMKQF